MTSHSDDVIELRLRELGQMFESRDPAPFYDQDLAKEAEEWIVESADELPSKAPKRLLIHVAGSQDDDGEREAVRRAVHVHFARKAQHASRELRHLIRRGWISLAIGLSFLVAFFVLSQTVADALGETRWATLARESLVIGGWVAMWRPLEILLYDWWPIVGRRRLYRRLSAIDVQLRRPGA